MSRSACRLRAVAAAIVVVLLARGAAARVDVEVDFDKTFDFAAAQTWAWHPNGAGQVLMARTQEDDPEAMRKRVEPVIVEAVTGEMSRRGLQAAASMPDLLVAYYLLLSNTVSAQTLGQFVPVTPEWGLPPFPSQTQSLKILNTGSLVLDVSARSQVIWRGVAQAKIRLDADESRRQALIREAVRDLIRRLPGR